MELLPLRLGVGLPVSPHHSGSFSLEEASRISQVPREPFRAFALLSDPGRISTPRIMKMGLSRSETGSWQSPRRQVRPTFPCPGSLANIRSRNTFARTRARSSASRPVAVSHASCSISTSRLTSFPTSKPTATLRWGWVYPKIRRRRQRCGWLNGRI
jgi:hypothetical protein